MRPPFCERAKELDCPDPAQCTTFGCEGEPLQPPPEHRAERTIEDIVEEARRAGL